MRQENPAYPPSLEASAGRQGLLSRIYRDIGLAAVAIELDVLNDLDSELEDAIERGARFIAPVKLPLAS